MILIKAMVYALMMVCFVACSIICAYTDIMDSKIRNNVLAFFGLVSILSNGIYYMFFASEYVLVYIFNILILAIFSVLFYSFHIWSAGDSKFLIIIMSFVPITLYAKNIYEINAVIAIIIIFIIAFCYIIIESIYLGLKYKNFFKNNGNVVNLVSLIKQYIKCTFFVLCFDLTIGYMAPDFVGFNSHIILIINMLIVIIVPKFDSLNNNFILLLMFILIVIMCSVFKISLFSDYRIIMFMILIMYLSIICEKYNYRFVKTREITKNMVLAQSTIDVFSRSKIYDLPHTTTEDLRSKLNNAEVAAIKKWEKSKYGQKYIVIVKKMPFALFISIGCMAFVIISSFFYYC